MRPLTAAVRPAPLPRAAPHQDGEGGGAPEGLLVLLAGAMLGQGDYDALLAALRTEAAAAGVRLWVAVPFIDWSYMMVRTDALPWSARGGVQEKRHPQVAGPPRSAGPAPTLAPPCALLRPPPRAVAGVCGHAAVARVCR